MIRDKWFVIHYYPSLRLGIEKITLGKAASLLSKSRYVRQYNQSSGGAKLLKRLQM
jgi:hypothetical protein